MGPCDRYPGGADRCAKASLHDYRCQWHSFEYVQWHYSDVIMSAVAFQITSVSVVCSTVCSGADQRSIKAPRYWPLWRGFTGDLWIPRTKENVFIWWRHHGFDAKIRYLLTRIPDSKVHGANMGPTWVLAAPDGPHVGPMNLVIRDAIFLIINIDSD